MLSIKYICNLFNIMSENLISQLSTQIDDIYKIFNNITNEYDMYNQPYIKQLIDLKILLKKTVSKIDNVYQLCVNKYKTTLNIAGNTNIHVLNKIDNKSEQPSLSDTHNKQVTDSISLNVCFVHSIYDIPNMSIYWVSNINQFAFKLNGVIFRGNIGNIYTDADKIPSNQTVICKYGTSCKCIQRGDICKFFHDPMSTKISTNNILNNKIRNFSNKSWLYTKHTSNSNLRTFGSRNILNNELNLLAMENPSLINIQVDNYRHQCIHDILVILALNKKGLILMD